MKKLFGIGVMVILCVIAGLAACGGGGGGGGGSGDAGYSVSGPDAVLAGETATFSVTPTTDVSAYRWRVEGDAVLRTAADQPTVKVRAAAGNGQFTVHCEVMIGVVWQDAEPRAVIIGDLPRFKVVLRSPVDLAPTSLTGSGTITMASSSAEAQRWALYFVGDTSALPAQVKVTVTTTVAASFQNIWLDTAGQTKELTFPRSGGGSVGAGGSVLNLAPRPFFNTGGPGGTGTVTLTANGVQTMVITVKGY